jgi:hypothetical protein
MYIYIERNPKTFRGLNIYIDLIPPEKLGATCVYGAYVRPMLMALGGYVVAMFEPC